MDTLTPTPVVTPMKKNILIRALKWLNDLEWLEAITNFFFRFLFKSAELFLFFGIFVTIVDASMHNVVLTSNSPWTWAWIITQAAALEGSGGVMLQACFESREQNDRFKAWAQGILAILLLSFGGIMFFVHLNASSNGQSFTGNVDFNLWMSGLRSVVAIMYIALSRTKDVRWSGVSPSVKVQQADDAIARARELLENFSRVCESSLKNSVETITELSQKEIHLAKSSVQTSTELSQNILRELFTELLQNILRELSTELSQNFLSNTSTIRNEIITAIYEVSDRQLHRLADPTNTQPVVDADTIQRQMKELVASVNRQLEEGMQVLTLHMTSSIAEIFKNLPVNTAGPSLQAGPKRLTLPALSEKSQDSGATKKEFIEACLIDNPSIKNVEIIRRGEQQGLKILASQVSEVRKITAAGDVALTLVE